MQCDTFRPSMTTAARNDLFGQNRAVATDALDGLRQKFRQKLIRSCKQMRPCDRECVADTPLAFSPGKLSLRLLDRFSAYDSLSLQETSQMLCRAVRQLTSEINQW